MKIQTIKKYKTRIIAGLIALLGMIVGSAVYGLTQREVRKTKNELEQMSLKLKQIVSVNQQLQQESSSQTETVNMLKQNLTSSMNMTSSLAKENKYSVVKVLYDPNSGKAIERMIIRSEEKTHAANAATSSQNIVVEKVDMAKTEASASVKLYVTTIATMTESIETVKEKSSTSEVKPIVSDGNRDMRLSAGAMFSGNMFDASIAYRVKMFGIGDLISVGPAVVIGSKRLGVAAQADILKLPRIGVGYGCKYDMKKCGILYSLGLRIDF